MQLWVQRTAVISHENINKWEQLSPAFMTDESSDEDGTLVEHLLSWRSEGMLIITEMLNIYYNTLFPLKN